MTRFPNAVAALTQLFAKAFAPLMDRDGAGGRRAFVVGFADSRRTSIRVCESDLTTHATRLE